MCTSACASSLSMSSTSLSLSHLLARSYFHDVDSLALEPSLIFKNSWAG